MKFDNRFNDPRPLADVAAEFFCMRRARDSALPDGLTGEPAWDMLLALYSEVSSGLPISIACRASGVPMSSALRWVAALEKLGLIERVKHHRDQDLVFISLTDFAKFTVERSLRAMLRAAGP